MTSAILVLIMIMYVLIVGTAGLDINLSDSQNTTNTVVSAAANEDDEFNDPATQLFQKLFKHRRAEHLAAINGLLKLNYEKQHKMFLMIAEKIFVLIQSSRVTLESSGYVPGSREFPQDSNVRDALSNILENTALFAELVLRLPDLVQPILSAHHDWEILLRWSLSFCSETKLIDSSTVKLLHLVTQELGLVDREPDYINPYRKTSVSPNSRTFHLDLSQNKPKKRKQIKKGPQLSRHVEL